MLEQEILRLRRLCLLGSLSSIDGRKGLMMTMILYSKELGIGLNTEHWTLLHRPSCMRPPTDIYSATCGRPITRLHRFQDIGSAS